MSDDGKKSAPAAIKKAVALRYGPEGHETTGAVAAKGRLRLAERIIELARQHGVPIKQDPDLVEILARLDIDEEIPPELYVVAAEILAFVHRANEAWRLGAGDKEVK